mgnify:CR=1 FL=1
MQKPLIPALLFLFSGLFLFSCGKSDDTAAKTTYWQVSSYKVKLADSSAQPFDDQTDLFDNYSFEFNDDDKLIIHQPNGSIIEAKWRVNGTAATADFGIDGATSPLDIIHGSWGLAEKSDTDLKLNGKTVISTSTGNGDVLEFQKQ